MLLILSLLYGPLPLIPRESAFLSTVRLLSSAFVYSTMTVSGKRTMSFRDSTGRAAKKQVLWHPLYYQIIVQVNVRRHLYDCFRQHSHACVNRNDLHCRAVVDSLSCMSLSKEKTVGRAAVAALRLVP